MATLETSPEANSDRQRTEGQKKPIIGARATALPKKWYLEYSRFWKWSEHHHLRHYTILNFTQRKGYRRTFWSAELLPPREKIKASKSAYTRPYLKTNLFLSRILPLIYKRLWFWVLVIFQNIPPTENKVKGDPRFLWVGGGWFSNQL